MTLNFLKKLREMGINNICRMTLINVSGSVKNGSCYSILRNVQDGTKRLHLGRGNTVVNYEMGGTILYKTVKEKDLEIIHFKITKYKKC